ncbi:MAG: DUF11 domain-containing protein [Chloroflexota bacterium]|nr:DUF11 domain-containing protein [Chloroflexota bacterium]
MGDDIFKDDITRREAMKTALKAGAYAAPVVLAATVPEMVSAATPPPPSADISVTQTAVDTTLVSEDESGVFTVTARNLGPSAATGVVVSDPPPPSDPPPARFIGIPSSGTTYNQATGVWTIGNLAVGASATLTLSGTIEDTVMNTATRIASSPPDPNAANDTTTASLSTGP